MDDEKEILPTEAQETPNVQNVEPVTEPELPTEAQELSGAPKEYFDDFV